MRLRIGADDPRADPIRISQPALRGAIGDAHHAARRPARRRPLQPRPRGRQRRAVRVRPRLPAEAEDGAGEGAPGGPLPGPARRRPASEPHRLACLLVGAARAPVLAPRGEREPDFFALKGVLEARGRRAWRAQAEVAQAAGAVPSPRPLGQGRFGGGPAAGWIGELHPLVCRTWDLESAVAFEIDLAALIAASPAGVELYEDVTTFPAVIQDIAVVVAEETAAAEVIAAVSQGRRRAAALRPGLRPLPRASSSARSARASRCGSSSAPPIGPSPTRRSPDCGGGSRPSWRAIGGSLRD